MRAITAGLLGAALLCLPDPASAGPPIAWATRTTSFTSSSTTGVIIPLHDDNTTALTFETTADNQSVVITYNAECVVVAARGVWVTISIFVDGAQAAPASGQDFALCSALDTNGGSWASATRQSVVTVPSAGNHTINITARLRGGSGTFAVDDSSLVVQRNVRAAATNKNAFVSSSAVATELPLTDGGGTTLDFNTFVANDVVKFTYNAECVADAQPPGHSFIANFALDGTQTGITNVMCSPVDTTAKTWAGVLRQNVVTVPGAGTHQLKVIGALSSGSAVWRVDDSSVVVTRAILASGAHEQGLPLNSSMQQQPVPLRSNGMISLTFNTTAPNQAVKLGFYASCRIGGARGRWLGVRIVVDGIQASPASGFDFALCSSAGNGFLTPHAGFRQSIMIVPDAGEHTVHVFARPSQGPAVSWGLSTISMVVE